ncbi:MAG TPA: hypothetical protein VNS33_05865 [Bradyrhizobium sp.]|nr:hypothetical protein [Bradyrhizobium sp.]
MKIGFWLGTYDSLTVEADADPEAIEKAKIAATTAMTSTAHPEHVDFDERRGGGITFIDRVTPDGRQAVLENVAFDEDRIHSDGAITDKYGDPAAPHRLRFPRGVHTVTAE